MTDVIFIHLSVHQKGLPFYKQGALNCWTTLDQKFYGCMVINVEINLRRLFPLCFIICIHLYYWVMEVYRLPCIFLLMFILYSYGICCHMSLLGGECWDHETYMFHTKWPQKDGHIKRTYMKRLSYRVVLSRTTMSFIQKDFILLDFAYLDFISSSID